MSDGASPCYPSSPATEQAFHSMGPNLGNAASTTSNATSNNNNHKYDEEEDKDKQMGIKKHFHLKQQGPGDGSHDSQSFSDYTLLRKLFPHQDKTILLDALLSCDGSTVAAIQHLLTNNLGKKSERSSLQLKNDMSSMSGSHSDNKQQSKMASNNKIIENSNIPLVSPPLDFNKMKRFNSRRRSLEPNTPPPPPSLNLHGNTIQNQIGEAPPPLLHPGSSHLNLAHTHPHSNFNLPSSKLSSYAAAQAQQFYAQAHHRYLAAAAAAAASAIQQATPHGVGHPINNPQTPLALQQTMNNANQSGFFSGNFLGRPEFSQYLSNAAAVQQHISSSNRMASNVGIGSSNSNLNPLPAPHLVLNHSSGIPPMFQSNSGAGKVYDEAMNIVCIYLFS